MENQIPHYLAIKKDEEYKMLWKMLRYQISLYWWRSMWAVDIHVIKSEMSNKNIKIVLNLKTIET